jgi:hypothetical protein
VNGAHLRLGNAVRPAEIEPGGWNVALAFLDVLKNRVDFLLRKLPAQVSRSYAGYRRTVPRPLEFRLAGRALFFRRNANENQEETDEYMCEEPNGIRDSGG